MTVTLHRLFSNALMGEGQKLAKLVKSWLSSQPLNPFLSKELERKLAKLAVFINKNFPSYAKVEVFSGKRLTRPTSANLWLNALLLKALSSWLLSQLLTYLANL